MDGFWSLLRVEHRCGISRWPAQTLGPKHGPELPECGRADCGALPRQPLL